MPFLCLILIDVNHAPIWVFVLLVAAIAIISLILWFATYTGGEHDYWYADPQNHYYGSRGGPGSMPLQGNWGAFGGFGGFRGGL